MRAAAVICFAVLGCAQYVKPAPETEAQMAPDEVVEVDPLVVAVLGCWDLRPIHGKNMFLPAPTIVRLDSVASPDQPIYNHLERVTPNRTGVERNYWYITPGERHVRMKLGGASVGEWGAAVGVWIDVLLAADGKSMHPQMGEGAFVRAQRTDCPAENKDAES